MKEFSERVAVVETKIDRVIADMEEDRAHAAHSNVEVIGRIDRIDTAQRKTDRIIYMGLGGLALLQVVLQLPR